jgi:hypothetical protein
MRTWRANIRVKEWRRKQRKKEWMEKKRTFFFLLFSISSVSSSFLTLALAVRMDAGEKGGRKR